MLRNRKATILMLTTLGVAGCAHSDRPKQRYGEPLWRPADNAKSIEAVEAPSAAILPQTHFAAAKLFESQHLHGKAATQYRKAIAVDHTFVEAYHRLGLLLSRMGKHEQALDPLQRAVQLKPKNPVLRNNYGFEFLLNQRWVEAEQQFVRAVELKPDFPRAYINLGIVYSKVGRFDESLASFRSVLPEPDAYYNVGLMYRAQRRYTEAAEVFEYVLRLDPSFAAARTQLKQVASRRPPGTTPGWDRQPRKKVTKASDRANLPQARPRITLPTAQPPKARTPKKPTDRPQHGDKQSRAKDQGSLDGTIAKLDHALARLETPTAGRTGHRTAAQKSARTGRTGSDREQLDIEMLLTRIENQTRRLDRTERKPTTAARRTKKNTKTQRFTSARKPTRTAEVKTKPQRATVDRRENRATSQRIAKPTSKLHTQGVNKPQRAKRRSATERPRRQIAKRLPTLPTRQKIARGGRDYPNRAIESFVGTGEFCPGDPPRIFNTVRGLEGSQPTLGTGDVLDPFAISCVDTLALVRELEEQLIIVRNEIDCIEGHDIDFDETFTRRGSTPEIDASMFSTGSDFITLPLLTTGDTDDFGPPLELARRQGKGTTATKPIRRRARLASTVIDEKPKNTKTPVDRTKRIKTTKPKKTTKPISRADDWRSRYQDLEGLLEITQNELACLEDQTGTDNAWSAIMRDTVGDPLFGHAAPLD